MVLDVRWFDGNLHTHWSLLDDWEWNVLLVDDGTVDWDMHWVRHGLLDVVRNLMRVVGVDLATWLEL